MTPKQRKKELTDACRAGLNSYLETTRGCQHFPKWAITNISDTELQVKINTQEDGPIYFTIKVTAPVS